MPYMKAQKPKAEQTEDSGLQSVAGSEAGEPVP
jgi:hypothetical protein